MTFSEFQKKYGKSYSEQLKKFAKDTSYFSLYDGYGLLHPSKVLVRLFSAKRKFSTKLIIEEQRDYEIASNTGVVIKHSCVEGKLRSGHLVTLPFNDTAEMTMHPDWEIYKQAVAETGGAGNAIPMPPKGIPEYIPAVDRVHGHKKVKQIFNTVLSPNDHRTFLFDLYDLDFVIDTTGWE